MRAKLFGCIRIVTEPSALRVGGTSVQVRTRSVSRQRAVLLRPMLDRLAEPEVDLRARASQSMRGKERLHLGAVRAGGRTAREATALER